MLQSVVLGIIQGVVEWLPISSEGMLVLAQVKLFGSTDPLAEQIRISLFLHFGTFLAALFYFRKDVKTLLLYLFTFRNNNAKQREAQKSSVPHINKDRKVLGFLIITTLITGILGALLLVLVGEIADRLELTGRALMVFIGFLLLMTGFLQIRAKKNPSKFETLNDRSVEGETHVKTEWNLKTFDAILLGIMQAFAILPGLSRSGLTVAGLLLRRFDDAVALRLSFLMSLPVVLMGNLILNIDKFTFDPVFFGGLAAAFVFGLLTIRGFLKLAQKINFGYFAFIFGLLTVFASVV